eukprot:773574-Prymnesium_polylepis.2
MASRAASDSLLDSLLTPPRVLSLTVDESLGPRALTSLCLRHQLLKPTNENTRSATDPAPIPTQIITLRALPLGGPRGGGGGLSGGGGEGGARGGGNGGGGATAMSATTSTVTPRFAESVGESLEVSSCEAVYSAATASLSEMASGDVRSTVATRLPDRSSSST